MIDACFALGLRDRLRHPEFDRGIVAYSATDIRQILGFTYGDEIIHRDDLGIL